MTEQKNFRLKKNKKEERTLVGVEEKDANVVRYTALKSSMTPEDVEGLYADFKATIEETKDLEDSVSYTIKKTRYGFEIEKTDDETGAKIKVFKIHNGNVILRSPIEKNSVEEGGWLRIYFDRQTEENKDILVSKCNSFNSAIKLANLAQVCGTRLMFKEEVLVSLEKNHPALREQLKDILGTEDISLSTSHRMKM